MMDNINNKHGVCRNCIKYNWTRIDSTNPSSHNPFGNEKMQVCTIDEITPAANASAFASNAIGGIRLTDADMKRYHEAKRLQEQKAKESSEKSSILFDIDLISY